MRMRPENYPDITMAELLVALMQRSKIQKCQLFAAYGYGWAQAMRDLHSLGIVEEVVNQHGSCFRVLPMRSHILAGWQLPEIQQLQHK